MSLHPSEIPEIRKDGPRYSVEEWYGRMMGWIGDDFKTADEAWAAYNKIHYGEKRLVDHRTGRVLASHI